MNKFISSISLILILSLVLPLVVAQLSVGVRSGDWIEYNVSSNGSPLQGHDITWARMEIVSVEGFKISVTITSRFDDNSTETTNHVLNLQTGHLIDNFIIPASLGLGETFIDETLGNVTISRVEERLYAAATRTVVSSSVGNNTYVWDQATGVSVEGDSTGPNWTIHTVVSDTNMWKPSSRINWIWIGLIFIAIIALALIVWYLFRKNKTGRRSS